MVKDGLRQKEDHTDTGYSDVLEAVQRCYPFAGMGHGEIIGYPEQMAKEIKRFIERR